MKAFLTGSRRYGTVKPESDIDMVVRTEDLRLLTELTNHADSTGSLIPGSQNVSVKFGKLNLLICLSDEAYLAWLEGTSELCECMPVTRDVAVSVFDSKRDSYGVE